MFQNKYYISKSRFLNILALALLIVFLVSAALFFISKWEKKQGAYEGSSTETLSQTLRYNGKEYILKENVETYLFLGLDKFDAEKPESYNNDKQADFLMLIVVDNKDSSFTALHINRDTMAEMNILGVAGEKIGTAKKQIALAHTYGNGREVSCRNTANAVSKLLLNAEINHYVSVTMDAVPIYNDLLGGVEVTVLDDFTGIDDTLVKDEKITLLGQHALNYVRTRYGLDDSTNAHRMKRQRQYLKALHEKTVKCYEDEPAFIGQSVLKLTDYIVSDCSVNKLQTFAEKVSSYKFNEICTLDGENVTGERFMEFHPDEESVMSTAIKLFYKLQD